MISRKDRMKRKISIKQGLFYLITLLFASSFIASCGECEDNQWNRFWKIYDTEKCEYEPDEQQSHLEFPPSPMEHINQT